MMKKLKNKIKQIIMYNHQIIKLLNNQIIKLSNYQIIGKHGYYLFKKLFVI